MKKQFTRLWLGLIAIVFLVSLFQAPTSKVQAADGVEFEYSPTQRYNITFKDKKSGKANLNNLGAKMHGEFTFSPNTVTATLSDKDIDKVARHPHTVKIEVDELIKQDAVYTAPFDSATWTFDSHNSKQAYSRGYSGQGVKVAILDSGVDKSNPRLTHAIKGGIGITSWTGGDYQDYSGHGTNVAGALAAKDANGKPYGIAPDAHLYPVVVSTTKTNGSAYQSDIARGLEWAILNNMDVVNISYSASSGSEIQQAMIVANRANIFVSNSAGNFQENRDTDIGRCNLEGLYCIAAIDKFDKRASFSAYGATGIEQAAAGDEVPVVIIGSPSLYTAGGTSFASPTFAGIYALYKSEYPNATKDVILAHMRSVAKPLVTDKPIGKGKAYYSPMPKGTKQWLTTTNYYYSSSKQLYATAYDANVDKQMTRVSFELWELNRWTGFDFTSTTYVSNLGIINNVQADTSYINANVTLDPNKVYLIKTIVDFSGGERQWNYETIKGHNYQ